MSAENAAVAQADPRFVAAVDLLRRTGAKSLQVRWSDEPEPTVWIVVVEHAIGPDGAPAVEGRVRYDAAAGMSPLGAALRLCETLIDGGTCRHCYRPSGFTEDFDAMPADDLVCWYQFDPELATFRRGCEGS